MSVMEREEAVERAHGYLSKNGANNWKQGQELKRRTQEGLGYMETVQLIADIYQRGERPGDRLDLQTIDFSLSYEEIKSGINEALDDLGAQQFENIEEQELESQMDRMEAMVEKEREQMENIREEVEEEVEQLTAEEEEGRLFQARNQAWTGYRLALLETRGMFDALVEAIEYARAILEIDEQLGVNFDPDEMERDAFEELRQRAQKMKEFSSEIEGLNFEAEEIDQSEIGDSEDQEEDPEDLEEVITRTLEGNDREMERFDLINQVEGQTTFSEEEIEKKLEELETRGDIFQPQRGSVSLLDHSAALEYGKPLLRDHQETLADTDRELLASEPFGEMTVQIVQNEDPPELESFPEVRDFLQDKLGTQAREHFMAIYLDGSNDVLATQTIGVGGLDSVKVNSRAIIQSGIVTSASGVIVVHNHPSGALEFTEEDIQATRQLQTEMEQFDLDLLDHIVASSEGAVSLRNENREIFNSPPPFYAK